MITNVVGLIILAICAVYVVYMVIKKKYSKWMLIVVGIMVVGAIILGISFYRESNKIQNDVTVQKEYDNPVVYNKVNKNLRDTSFILDTCYDGTTDADANLYEIRFQKTSSYIPNKEYVKLVSENQIDELISLYDKFAEALLGRQFRTVAENKDAFTQSLKDVMLDGVYYIESSDTEYASLDDYAKVVRDWYIANEAQLTAEGKTDKTLVYEDGLIYVRGKTVITPYTPIDVKTAEEIFDVKLNESEPTEVILEIGITNTGGKYKVVGWQVLR